MIPLCLGFLGIRTHSALCIAGCIGGILGISIGYIYARELGIITVATGVIGNIIMFALAFAFLKAFMHSTEKLKKPLLTM